MKTRWHISIFIIVLTILGGIASQHEVKTPNQEILLHFTSETINSCSAQNTITRVKEQLKTAGAAHIKVETLYNGGLKITYYSAADITIIKALLSDDRSLDLGVVTANHNHNNLPFEDHTVDYDIDVYEIQQTTDVSSIDGKLAVETKVEYDRFSHTNVLSAPEQADIDIIERIAKVAYKFRRNVAVAIDHNSYKIPEVRAGPSDSSFDDLG